MAPDMASPAHELTLDFKPSNTYASAFQKPHGDQHALQQNQKIHEFLTRLEEERRKIDAFKRELPLCMQLLNNAIEIYKQQLEAFHRTGDGHAQRPVLEEFFIPLKQMDGDGGADPKAAAPSEKANWMVSAQLWSPVFDEAKPLAALAPPREAEHGAAGGFDVSGSPKLALDSKQRNGGAFLPFSKEKNKTSSCSVRAANPRALPELALASAPDKPVEEKKKCAELEVNGSRENNCTNGKGGSTTEAQGVAAALATHRKARRCWSPDLHRRFVNALQILGGSQVATPKQIRELMKVDGLTNDEVKSHLQKYRLHTRRPPPAPAASAAAAPQLVVLGGIWVPQEFATPSGGASAIYSAAHAAAASAHYCAAAPPVPQEFYPLPQQTVAAQHHLHAPGAYKVRASPESEVRSDGVERCESVEEGEEGKEEMEDEEEEEGEETPEKEMARAEIGGVALKF